MLIPSANLKERVWFGRICLRGIVPDLIFLLYIFYFLYFSSKYFIEHTLGNASSGSDIEVDFVHVAFSAY